MLTGTILIAFTVEEFLIVDDHQHLIGTFHYFLATKYTIKRLVRPNIFLGWTISFPSDGRIVISQPSLVLTTIINASIASINGRKTPYSYGEYLQPPMPHDKPLPSTAPKFRKSVGDLRYLCDSTRPDLYFITGILGRAMHLPTTRNWRKIKAVIRYLIMTKHLGIRLPPEQKRAVTLRLLHAYAEAIFGRQPGDRQSTLEL